MKSLKYLFLALAVVIVGCDNNQKKGGGVARPKAEESNPRQTMTTNEETEIKQGDNWGYDDKPSPDADLTREPPLEVKGGLVHDVGAIKSGEKRLYTLILRNTSDKPWKLQSVDADCACTNIDGFPGGVMMQPGKELPIVLRIDGSKIAAGAFEKHVMLSPLEYKTVRVAIKGKLERFFATVPNGRRIHFSAKGDPQTKWESSIDIIGVENYKDELELSIQEKAIENPYIQATLEKKDSNTWKLTAKPIRALPYADTFSEEIILKVLKPEGLPIISIPVQGAVGMKIRWNAPKGKSMILKEEDFKDGIAKLNLQLGVDINDPNTTVNERLMRRVENVEWQKLFDTLEFKMPEGVKYEKKFTRFGVRLELSAPRAAFNDKGILRIENGCNGNWEGSPIVLRIKKRDGRDE